MDRKNDPIGGIDPKALKVRIRRRADRPVKVFVRTASETKSYYVTRDEATKALILGDIIGSNKRIDIINRFLKKPN